MNQSDRCIDKRCRACDLRIALAKREVKPIVYDGAFYLVLVEIDSDGRIDHERNFEIVPGYSRYDGEERRWTILRSMGEALEYREDSITVISPLLGESLTAWDMRGRVRR